jgi:UDP-MurNAc hydroxylase
MEFQVLSHAGLLIRSRHTTLVCDPWLVGSVYWRSWWNYPPVSKDLVESLHPDFVYLTHIHWDHFQGVSLGRFDPATTVFVPKSPSDRRMVGDLTDIGFSGVIEVAHGESVRLDPGFTITSYHFGPCPDSVLVAECEGVTILNANDAKVMGRPLEQILEGHAPIDFVLSSHSSANSRVREVVVRP